MIFLFKARKASVALISILVIMSFTLILAVAMSDAALMTAYQYVNSDASRGAYYLAEGCFEEAMVQLENDITFSSGSIVYDSDRSCTFSVTGTNPKTISIAVTYFEYSQNFIGKASYTSSGEVNNFQLDDWDEV